MFCQLNDIKEENRNNSGSKQILSLGNPFFLGKCYLEDTKKTRFNNPNNDEDDDLFPPLSSHPI